MNTLRTWYNRLVQLQGKLSFRVACSVLALLICGGVFGSLIVTSYSLNQQRLNIVPYLDGQNFNQPDGEYARSLLNEGQITVDGKTYYSAQIEFSPAMIFDDQGNIISADSVANLLLKDQRPEWAPEWLLEQPGTTWLLAVVVTTWLLLVIWLQAVAPLLMTALGAGVPLSIGWFLGNYGEALGASWWLSWCWPVLKNFLPWFLADQQVMIYIAGLGVFTYTFILLSHLAMVLYSRPNQIMAVAHTLMKEASRTRLSLVFIVALLLILPLLPMNLDADSPLRYRVQTFISRSFATTFSIAAVLTIFLSCASIAFEIRDRQIWQLMTKPMNRLSYLLGKWLGVMTLNLIILIVAGLSTFTYIQYLRTLPVAPGIDGMLDALAVSDQVLTARISRQPTYDRLSEEQLRAREEQAISRDTELSGMDEVPLSIRRIVRADIIQDNEVGQRTIPPHLTKTYLFTGLSGAKQMQSSMTLRYRFYIMHNDDHDVFRAIFRFNDDPTTDRIRNYVPTQAHVFPIGTNLIRDDGTLKLEIYNDYTPSPEFHGSLNFESDGLELLHKVANFEGNFLRAILVTWAKLAFLAALGICCATFLSFPVACLSSFTIFIAGMLGPFVADSLAQYIPMELSEIPAGEIGLYIEWFFTKITRGLAHTIVFMLQGFGEFNPSRNLVEGKLIPWVTVIVSFGKLVVLWSGLAMLIGYTVIRNRQLAIYSGQG